MHHQASSMENHNHVVPAYCTLLCVYGQEQNVQQTLSQPRKSKSTPPKQDKKGSQIHEQPGDAVC